MIEYIQVILTAMGSSEGEEGGLIFILLTAGFIFYGVVYNKYRNKKARHMHEKETASLVENVSGYDTYAQSLKGLSNSRMAGANNTKVKGALNSNAKKGVADKVINQVMPGGLGGLMR